MIVNLTEKHRGELQAIHKEDFPLPEYGNGLYLRSKAVVTPSGKLVGAGFLKLTSETSLILNPSLSRISRARIIKDLIASLQRDLEQAGLDGTHVFLQGNEVDKTEAFLESFGFVKVAERPMYLGLGDKNGKAA